MEELNEVALYCRISGDDGTQDESLSITNQKQILERYARENGFTNYKIYVDERRTGTNFDRPAWQEIQESIEKNIIKTVIVKDSSRLGRNYISVGDILENFFPKYGVRYIAVTEGVDTLYGEDEMLAFRSIYNEYHSKETSRKLRASHINKAKSGGRVGGRAPYGYIKDDENKLVVDEEVVEIIKFIFQSALDNAGPVQIAEELSQKQVLVPSALFFERTGKILSTYNPSYPTNWIPQTVIEILKNQVYIGNTVNLKTTTVSFKNKTKVHNPPEKQIIVENSHQAIIDKDVFDIIQGKRKHKKGAISVDKSKVNLFADLLFCKDCGSKMALYRSSKHNKQSRYYCKLYQSRGRHTCLPHHITEEVLIQVVLTTIQSLLTLSQNDVDFFENYIATKQELKQRKEIQAMEKEIVKAESRLREISAVVKQLYEDKVLGKMEEALFYKLSADFCTEELDLKSSVEVKSKALQEYKVRSSEVDTFSRTLKSYTEITKENLSPQILNLLIERIEVGEKDRPRAKDYKQDVDIYFRGIGMMEESDKEAK